MTTPRTPSSISVHTLNDRMERPDRLFRGYCTDYRYVNINHWEYSQGMFSDRWTNHDLALNTFPIGDSIGHATDAIWKVKVVSGCRYHTPADYARTLVWIKPTIGLDGAIPIELHHSDVLPSLLPGSVITIQVSLVPSYVHYVKTDDPEDMPYARREPVRVLNEEESFKTDKVNVVHVAGGIHCVERIPATDLEGEKCFVWLSTRFGPLCVIHPLDQVPESERVFIQENNFVIVQGVLTADCAVDEYANGALHDDSSYLTLLKDSLMTGRMFRFFRAMDPHCELLVGSETTCVPNNVDDRRQDILDKLTRWFSHGELSTCCRTDIARHEIVSALLHRTPNGKPDAQIAFELGDHSRIMRIVIDRSPVTLKAFFNTRRVRKNSARAGGC